MLDFLFNLIQALTLGLLTPLTAVCVLPLYPAFLTYLSKQVDTSLEDKNQVLKFGILVSAGVISFMLIIGLLFTTILEVSLTNIISIISPIAFTILALMSINLIFNLKFNFIKLPHIITPESKNPYISAFLYGFFFGAIVIPCNPLIIAALFAKSVTITSFAQNILSFIFFGLGISIPLLMLATFSDTKSKTFMNFIIDNNKIINKISGLIMLTISIYYLIFVFKIFG
jgi:cytochrome c-type biogenesis protein